MLQRFALALAALLLYVPAVAQSTAGSQATTQGQSQSTSPPVRPWFRRGPPAGRPGGAWWRNSEVAKQLDLSDTQAQQIEKVFQGHRAQLLDLHTALNQEESRLQPLVAAEHPEEAQVFAQIDKVAAARAELEKANSRMLFAMRRVLTAQQWQKLEQLGQGLGMGMGRGPGMGPGMGQGMGMGRGFDEKKEEGTGRRPLK